MRCSILRYTLLLSILLFSILVFAEGTKEAAPNASITINGNTTNDIAALLIDHDSYNNFASYNNNDPNSRLYIHISDPGSECIFLGFSVGHVNGNDSNPGQLTYEYRIKDPNGNVVYGPVVVQPGNENIANWSEAFNGPMQVVGSGGYPAIEVTSTDLMSGGWLTAGDYYIEFDNITNNNEVLIDYWDITVSSCQLNPVPKPGRLWSYNWALFAVNDFGFPNRPFNGSFHVCAPDPTDNDRAFVTKIDFNESGFRPAAFNVAFNSFGLDNTGNIASDRQSRELVNATQSEYAIFLNDPVDLCETAFTGSIDLLGISRCSPDEYCILFTTTKGGQVDLLLDFDGNDNIYSPGTRDVLISQHVPTSQINQPTCLDWDGLDGLGQPLPELVSTTIPVTIAFAQGIYHFPIYDAELMTEGFQISAIRPTGPDPLLYYDDSQISVSSDSGEPPIQLSGCTLPCHRWLNYTSNTVPGFGNLHTINSWWFSQSVVEEELVSLPATYTCDIIGPDTLCMSDTMALSVQMEALPMGISPPTILTYLWTGPGVVGSVTGSSVDIRSGGTYNLLVHWLNNFGEVCQTECSIEVVESESCCQFEMKCEMQSTSLSCTDSIPPPLMSIDQLIDSGLLLVMDLQCSNLQMEVTVHSEGSGCAGDIKRIQYIYELWDDMNNNHLMDTSEVSVICGQEYVLIDTVSPEVMFTGMLDGLSSGDTLYIDCKAADSTWSMPMPGPDDVVVFDACSDVTVTMIDQTMESTDCETDGFISLSRCIYHVVDACGNQDSLVFFMMLQDVTPPVILEVAPDITITCQEPLPEGWSVANDECDCAHLTMTLDTLDLVCADRYTLQRTYTWVDHCGNKTEMTQKIQVLESIDISIVLPPPFQDSSHLEVPCTQGTLPMWVAELDASSISVVGGCSDWYVDYDIDQIESTDCSVGYVSRYRLIWTISDGCGNMMEEVAEVTVVDKEPPVILQYPDQNCQSSFDPMSIVVSDNCFVDRIEFVEENAGLNCIGELQIRQIWHIYDGCGNLTIGEQLIIENDLSPPVISVNKPDLQSGDTLFYPCAHFGEIGPPANLVISAEDNCQEVTDIVFEETVISELDCSNSYLGQYLLKWTATDLCGNQASFELFKMIDRPNRNDLITDEVYQIECMAELPEPKPTGCIESIELLSMKIESPCSSLKSYKTYRFVPYCGMNVVDTLWFVIHDSQPPELSSLPEVLCNGDTLPTIHGWDVCSQKYYEVKMSQNQKVICELTYTEVQYRVEDDCGNVNVQTSTILPDLLELDTDILFDGISCVPGPTDTMTLVRPCGYVLDTSLVSFTPDCPLLNLELDIERHPSDCNQTLFGYSDLYLFTLESECGVQERGIVRVEYTDNHQPVFLDAPKDISISCIDILPSIDVEVFDDCGTVDVTVDIRVDSSMTGYKVYTQSWVANDGCGNNSWHERTITKFDPPDCAIILPDTIGCHTRVQIEAYSESQALPLQYRWNIIEGACAIQSTSEHEPTIDLMIFRGQVILELEITDAYGCRVICQDTFECQNKTTQALGQRSEIDIAEFNVFPNPTEDILYFKAENVISELQVIDFSGRSVLTFKPGQPSGQISMGMLAKGVYLIHAIGPNGKGIYRKVIR